MFFAVSEIKRQMSLVDHVRRFRKLDNELKAANTTASKLREDRKIEELHIVDYLKSPQYATIQKLDISDDGSVIKIQRPDTYSKPWGLSVKDLLTHLQKFEASGKPFSAQACWEFMVDKRKMELVATEFSFTRYMSKADNDV